MEAIVAWSVIGIVAFLFAAMTVVPMMVETGSRSARRQLVLVHSADRAVHPDDDTRAA